MLFYVSVADYSKSVKKYQFLIFLLSVSLWFGDLVSQSASWLFFLLQDTTNNMLVIY